MNKIGLIFIGVLILGLAAGCQTISEKRKVDYKNTKTLPPLEIPPDLSSLPESRDPTANIGSAGASATYSGFIGDKKSQPAATKESVLPEFSGIALARDGQQRWLVVNAEPQTLWEPVREFVLSNGLLIGRENPQSGVIETEWAENRAKIGTGAQRLLAKWLSSLYSTGTRDKFRIRLERGVKPGTTEIYLSHQGMEEVAPENPSSGPAGSLWRPRPSEPEIEAEMLRLLVAHIGGRKAAVAALPANQTENPKQQATLGRNGAGAPLLTLQDSLDRAWRRVGLSLDRVGFTVEDRDRSKGIYYVRYIDPDKDGKKKGALSKFFGADKETRRDQYQVHLKESEIGTAVEVLDKDGAPDTSKTGERILSLLYEQLK